MPNDDRPKIWGQLDPAIYEYFFRKIFAGDRGIKQRLINQFFIALYEECRRLHIKAEWCPESGKAIKSIMDNINFKHAHRSRRPVDKAAKHQAQQSISGHVRPATQGICDPTTDPHRET